MAGGRAGTNIVVLNGPQGAQGIQGLQGPQGNIGAQGSQGSQGIQGQAGNQGAQGSGGAQGNQGNQGPQGAQGNQGQVGNQGAQGSDGAQGNQGNQGPQGSQGNQGAQGAASTVQGPQGYQGAASTVQGPQGNQGAASTVQGPQGTQGYQGAAATLTDNSVTYAKIAAALKQKNAVTASVDLSANGIGEITLSTNTAFSFSNFELNKTYLLKITANGYTPSWSAAAKHVPVEGNATFGTSGVFYVSLTCIDATAGSEKLLTLIMKGV
ncbi:MAG TPA: hypothetical protein PKH68_01380 [Paludibacteraceae bacterium]|nr:hypothetical protein [Paludibacteraceae bacterium]